MSVSQPSSSAEIRARLDHPVIDSDGHIVEFQSVVMTYLKETAGASAVDRYLAYQKRLAATPSERREGRLMRLPFWQLPSRNTLDRATCALPALLYERMEEFGFDFVVIYPTMGLIAYEIDDEEVRRAACRAYNIYNSEVCREFADRMTPVAIIPMHTPQEAIDELEHAVGKLGMKGVLLAGYVRRPIPAAARISPEAARFGYWLDTYGMDSEHDYDPVWAKCIELGVCPTFHSGTMGQWTRRSMSNYVYNHIGHFATAGEATCRSLFMNGVTRRFPKLKLAFLECGAGWACGLYADIIGHWGKRNRTALENYNPDLLDRELFEGLFLKYGAELMRKRLEEPLPADPEVMSGREDPATLDDFAACEIGRVEDIRDLFIPNFYFGCEADDPLTAWAFNAKVNPLGARLRTLFGSDIGHWDVPEMREVTHEAYELVENGRISKEDFRDFVFSNAVSFWTALNRDFFTGTAIESEVEKVKGSADH